VDPDAVVEAAGAVPWRRRDGRLEVALVHRPRYDDWSWPKGKVDQSPYREQLPATAVREVGEETGLLVRLGRPLPTACYTVVRRSPGPQRKRVHYWAAEVIGGDGRLEHEIDEVAWLPVGEASSRLSYARDREQLRAVVVHDKAGQLETWPLRVVRHAHAVGRGHWRKDDRHRPLDARGAAQAAALVPLVTAYGVSRVVTSPSVRCTDTLAPFAERAGLRMRLRDGLSEEGYAAAPDRAARHLAKTIGRGEPAALCSHRPVLPDLLSALAASAGDDVTRDALTGAAEHGMGKGEVLVAHVRGTGEASQVVAVERHGAA
jgi:8-oxo-dGTP diphosphatase